MAQGYPSFIIGNKLTFDFKDIKDSDGRAFDPEKVRFKYQAPGEAVVTVDYPADGTERIEQGWFRLTVDIPYDVSAVGMWDAVGQGLTSDDESIIVRKEQFKIISDGLI